MDTQKKKKKTHLSHISHYQITMIMHVAIYYNTGAQEIPLCLFLLTKTETPMWQKQSGS